MTVASVPTNVQIKTQMAELEVDLSDGTPPSCLSLEAKQVWIDLAPVMIKARVLTELDVPMITRYCELTVDFRDAVTATRTARRDGKMEEAIWTSSIMRGLSAELGAIEKQFGMTPVVRSKLFIANSKRPQPQALAKVMTGKFSYHKPVAA